MTLYIYHIFIVYSEIMHRLCAMAGRVALLVSKGPPTYLFKTLCCEDELLWRVLIEKKESKDLDQNTKEKL